MKPHRTFTAQQRLAIVLEALRDDATVSEVCRKHGISPTLYYRWRDLLFANAERMLTKGTPKNDTREAQHTAEIARLQGVIAEVTAENLELKKLSGSSTRRRGFPSSSGQ